MLACVDVHYTQSSATAACLAFLSWVDEKASHERVITSTVAPALYESGELYRRELPYVLTVLDLLGRRPDLVIIDGYVWLGQGRPGLGAHLHEALGCTVIGVAKTRFRSADAVEIQRASTRPLFVTAIGMAASDAAEAVRTMHGPFRIPTLLRRVDQIARGIVTPA